MLTTLLISFGLLVLLGIPIGFAMGISSLIALLISGSIPLLIIPQRITVALDSFPLLAVPLFILTGELMNTGGITRRIIDFANALVGHLRGGLSHVNVLASMLFAGVSGSATADAAGIGAVLIPSMTKEGYDTDLAISVTAASATIGPIIPPSVTMVIYSSITGLSIGKLFLAGIIPGILFGLSQMAVGYIYSVRRKYPTKPKTPFRELLLALRRAFFPMLAPVIILWGIVGGVFTATEAGAVAVLYALILGFVYREITLKQLYTLLLRTGQSTAVVLIIIACANSFGWILATQQLPMVVVNMLTSFSSNPTVIFLLIIAALLLIGTVVEGLAALIILVPVLTPLAATYGYDPIHFALIVVLLLAIGTITPPVGILLFVTCGVARQPLKAVGSIIWVFVAGMICIVLLVTFFPPLATYLPELLMG